MNQTPITVLSDGKFEKLAGDVGKLLGDGQFAAQSAAGHILATMYWKVGTRIERERLTAKAGYRDGVLRQLAMRLDVGERTLQAAVQFARTYQGAPVPGLSWAHYRELIRLRDPEERGYYEMLASELDWSKRRMVAAIKAQAYDEHWEAGEPLPKAKLQRPREATHVYECEVKRVVDADTLLLDVDLGFEVIKRQRLRLAEIDVPEPETKAGQEALGYVLRRMAQAAVAVVKTSRKDVHGRYVGHLFYSMREAPAAEVFAEGVYLNQELLDRDLAVGL